MYMQGRNRLEVVVLYMPPRFPQGTHIVPTEVDILLIH